MNPLFSVIVGLEESLQIHLAAYGDKSLLLLAKEQPFGKLLLDILIGQLCDAGELFRLQLLEDMVNLILAPGAGIGRGRKAVHHIEGVHILVDIVVQCYDPLPVVGLCATGKDAEC